MPDQASLHVDFYGPVFARDAADALNENQPWPWQACVCDKQPELFTEHGGKLFCVHCGRQAVSKAKQP